MGWLLRPVQPWRPFVHLEMFLSISEGGISFAPAGQGNDFNGRLCFQNSAVQHLQCRNGVRIFEGVNKTSPGKAYFDLLKVKTATLAFCAGLGLDRAGNGSWCATSVAGWDSLRVSGCPPPWPREGLLVGSAGARFGALAVRNS